MSRQHHSIRHCALQGGAVKSDVPHFHFGSEAGVIDNRGLLPGASSNQQTEEQHGRVESQLVSHMRTLIPKPARKWAHHYTSGTGALACASVGWRPIARIT